MTAGRHSCINDSFSQSHSTLHLHSHYMGEIKGMITATQLAANASNGGLGCVYVIKHWESLLRLVPILVYISLVILQLYMYQL